MLMGSFEPWVSAGMFMTSTFVVVETAVGSWPMFGNGVGIGGAGGAGTLHTSGIP
jgi:hypothetical protein